MKILKGIEYIIYIFFITFPFISYNNLLYGSTSGRSLSFVLVSTVCTFLLAFYFLKKESILSLPKSVTALSCLVFFLTVVVSGILGSDLGTSFWSVVTRMTGIWYFFNLGIFIYTIWSVFSEKEKQNKLILCIIISTALYSILYLFHPNTEAYTFGNTSFAAMYIFGVFILSLYYPFQSEMKKWWMYLLPIILIINPAILNRNVWMGDLSRGLVGEARATTYIIILSIAFIFVLWLISKAGKYRTYLAYSLFSISIVAMIVSAFSLLSHDGYLKRLYLSQATAGRPLVWEMSEKVVKERPFLGWGTDSFEKVSERHYDNRLLQGEYGAEAWFDRAHNIFVDELVEGGFVGLLFYILIYLTIILSLLQRSLNGDTKNIRMFASMLIVYFSLHLLELQTAFDTSISYPMLGLMIAFALPHDKRLEIKDWVKYIALLVITIFSLVTFTLGWIPMTRALFVFPVLVNSPLDAHPFIWKTSNDFKKYISINPSILDDTNQVVILKRDVQNFEDLFKKYIVDNPNSFRARLNLADMLIFQNLFGVNKLVEAQTILDEAILLVPQAPQSYWMKSVAYLYMGKFNEAREFANKGLELNPSIKQSQRLVEYIDSSIENFPNIDLFFFSQI